MLRGRLRICRRSAVTIKRMPRGKRHLLMGLAALLAAGVLTVPLHRAMTQGKAEAPAGKSKPEAKPKAIAVANGNTAPALPALTPPSAEMILVMIRSTLITLNDALRTGNYTVLRDLSAPSFRDRNTAGRLHQIFSGLGTKGIDLSAAAILAPKLRQAPDIDENRHLKISGYFPGQPVQINFDMAFEAVAGQWRLFGISVNPVKREPAATALQDTEAPAAGKPPQKSTKTMPPN
jgi:hypothetical protein